MKKRLLNKLIEQRLELKIKLEEKEKQLDEIKDFLGLGFGYVRELSTNIAKELRFDLKLLDELIDGMTNGRIKVKKPWGLCMCPNAKWWRYLWKKEVKDE